MAAPQPLRVLCLAGFRQSERGFHEKTGALRKALRGRAELVCLSGPHPVVDTAGAGPESGSCPPEEQPRGWWFSEQGGRRFLRAGRARGVQRRACNWLADSLAPSLSPTLVATSFQQLHHSVQAYLKFLDQFAE